VKEFDSDAVCMQTAAYSQVNLPVDVTHIADEVKAYLDELADDWTKNNHGEMRTELAIYTSAHRRRDEFLDVSWLFSIQAGLYLRSR